MDDLQQLETWAAPLLAKLESSQRRALARTIGVSLRRSQTQRIRSQQNPDGSAYAPRKRDKAGAIKRQRDRMFQRITTARHFQVKADERGVAVGFLGRVARIALVHQEGRTDRVAPGGPSIRYDRRELLGFTSAEREAIRDLLVEHLTK